MDQLDESLRGRVRAGAGRHEDVPSQPGRYGSEYEQPDPGELEERAIGRELVDLRRRQTAQRRLQAENAPPFRVLDFVEYLNSPGPEPLVQGVLYRDSLARFFGEPGCGKSFIALDVALRVALGRPWAELPVQQGAVVYVMAEGQRVNVERTRAWLNHHATPPVELHDKFYVVPDAVPLVKESVGDLVELVRRVNAVLVVCDTKNAMQVGEENSASDFARMREAMDLIRKASGACVLLIDHVGHDHDRARGSSAGTAAMDTEVRVRSDGAAPQTITATVRRDKAAEPGLTRDFRLERHEPAAVPVSTTPPTRVTDDRSAQPAWTTTDSSAIPSDLLAYEGAGAKVIGELARYLAHDAAAGVADPNEVGVTRSEAVKALRAAGVISKDDTSVRRAWSTLLDRGDITAAEGVKTPVGRHVWTR